MSEYVMVSGWFCIGSIGAIVVAGFLSGALMIVLEGRIIRDDGH